MPRFRYEALTSTGATISSTQEASSKAELVSRLKVSGYWPTNIVEEGSAAETEKKFQIPLLRRRIKSAEVEFFTEQLATLIGSHIPLPRSLAITIDQITNPELQSIVEQVRYDVEHGSMLNVALAQHPKVFSNLYVNMVKAGVTGGVLDVVLKRLAEFYQRQRLLKNQVVSALTYPAILFGLSAITVLILMLFVIPKFIGMFVDMQVKLPGPTQFLINITDFLRAYWWGIAVVGIGSVFGIRQYIRTERGLLVFDRIKLKAPLLGPILGTFALVRFTRTLATLLENGVLLLPAVQVVKDIVGNKAYSNGLEEAAKQIEHGSTLSRELRQNGDFPLLVTQMVAVGEESGNPEQMLSKLSDYYDVEIEKNLERLTSLIGPLVILFMGLIIGFIAVAMILPIYDANRLLGG